MVDEYEYFGVYNPNPSESQPIDQWSFSITEKLAGLEMYVLNNCDLSNDEKTRLDRLLNECQKICSLHEQKKTVKPWIPTLDSSQ